MCWGWRQAWVPDESSESMGIKSGALAFSLQNPLEVWNLEKYLFPGSGVHCDNEQNGNERKMFSESPIARMEHVMEVRSSSGFLLAVYFVGH